MVLKPYLYLTIQFLDFASKAKQKLLKSAGVVVVRRSEYFRFVGRYKHLNILEIILMCYIV